MKLNIHWKATAMATAAERMVLGKISDISTQQIGPHENMNDAEYTIIETTGTSGDTLTTFDSATPIAPSAIPIEPHINKGLRPSFSTVNTATRVKTMFTIPMITVCTIGLPMPIESKIRGA